MPGHEEFNAGLRERAADNLGNITGQPASTGGGGGGSIQDLINALTLPSEVNPTPTQEAQELANLLRQFAGQSQLTSPTRAPTGVQEPTPQPPAPLIDPQILAQIQAIVSSIDPNLNLDPASLASLLSTVTDEVGRTKTGVLDQRASQLIAQRATQLSQANLKAGQAESKAEAAQVTAGQKAEDRTRKEEDRQRQIQSDQLTIQQQEQNLTEADIPKTTEALITKALAEGDFDMARRVNDFRNEPTNAEKLRLALDFASSPSDVFTLSAIADGVFPGQFDKFEGIRSSPRGPALNALLDATLGVNQPAPAAPQQPAPEALQPPPAVTEPAPLSSFRSPEAGGVPLQPQPFSQPGLPPPSQQLPQFDLEDDFGVEGPFRRSELQDTGFEEGGAFGPIPSRFDEGFQNIDPSRLPTQATTPIGGSAAANPFDAGLRFPANEPFAREGQLPGIDPLSEPGLQDIPAQGLPSRNQGIQQGPTNRTLPFAGFIPEGTPTFNTQFDGQDIRLPQRFGTLFRGIKDPSQQLKRPQSALGFRGLPRPDPGTFGKLTAAEQDAFFGLAQFAGADVRDVRREIESGRPKQPRFTRITSAATRSR